MLHSTKSPVPGQDGGKFGQLCEIFKTSSDSTKCTNIYQNSIYGPECNLELIGGSI